MVNGVVNMKLKRILATSSAWKRFDALQKLRGQGMDIESGMKSLANSLALAYREMEQEAEPEGGPIADRYADQIHKMEKKYQWYKKQFKSTQKQIDKLEQF